MSIYGICFSFKCQKEKGKKDWYYSKSYYLEIAAHILLNILQITSLQVHVPRVEP